jgi:hypothetical protein
MSFTYCARVVVYRVDLLAIHAVPRAARRSRSIIVPERDEPNRIAREYHRRWKYMDTSTQVTKLSMTRTPSYITAGRLPRLISSLVSPIGSVVADGDGVEADRRCV